jgi:hypothetical protein
MTRPRLASIKEARPFQRPSRGALIFEQGLRRKELSTSVSSSANQQVREDIALSCRFSWLRPYSGHPSSFFGLQALPPYKRLDTSAAFGVATFAGSEARNDF